MTGVYYGQATGRGRRRGVETRVSGRAGAETHRTATFAAVASVEIERPPFPCNGATAAPSAGVKVEFAPHSTIGSLGGLRVNRFTIDTAHTQNETFCIRPRQETAACRSSMTLKCWSATSPKEIPSIDTSESLPTGTNQANHMGRGRATPKSSRCRSQSSNWNKDAVDNSDESEEDCFDAMAATIPAPSHLIHAMPALWVSGRRRHSRSRSRRRSISDNYHNVNSNGIHLTDCSSHQMSTGSRLSSTMSSGNEQLREAAAAAGAGGILLNQRLRITSPDGPRFAGWVRGQAADVQWEALDPSVQCVRIDVCNVAWTVPTTIAHRVANDGTFRWRRVYWGMPIAEGYYVNIYDVTEQKDPGEDSLLLAQSERFAVIK